DCWLNNPRVPREASGTSGMTAAMNGAVNFSTNDGWIPEFIHQGNNGFVVLGRPMHLPPLLSLDVYLLVQAMNFRKVREYTLPENAAHKVFVYEMGEGGPSAELHVAEQPDLPRAQSGAGGVHHVAFRTPNDEEYHGWNQRLRSLGIRSSGEIDRFYFHSLYFREPNGILFEIATDGPGFHVDEDMATMGEKVALPPFLEGQRAAIEANLKPID
ncbi:hypothetical protein EON80_13980, partial [bacterium]